MKKSSHVHADVIRTYFNHVEVCRKKRPFYEQEDLKLLQASPNITTTITTHYYDVTTKITTHKEICFQDIGICVCV